MFKGNTKNEDMYDEPDTTTATVIGVSVKLEGDFVSDGDVAVYGEVAGSIKSSGDVRIGETAIIKANVAGANVDVAGKVAGNVNADEKLNVGASGRIEGDIAAARLEVSDGAMINGRCTMGTVSAPSTTPAHNDDE